MSLPTHILLLYGYWVIFGWVLLEQLGAPLPAVPVLLAAGALCAGHEMSFLLVLLAGLVGALTSDSVWFFVGRRYGYRVLRMLCKLSMEPTVCARKTEDLFGRRRSIALLTSKFIPGLATLVLPVAGQSGMSYSQFLLLDGAGIVIWIGSMLIVGGFLGQLLRQNQYLLDWAGRFSGVLLAAGIVVFFIFRLISRRRILRELSRERIEPTELKQLIDAGTQVYIVDLRDAGDRGDDPGTVPGAQQFSSEELKLRRGEIPQGGEIVLFCGCPNEASAAELALWLHGNGIDRARALRGGYAEWKRLGYPLEGVQPGIYTK